MKVLCDFHHGGLYHAMSLLFEKRLGWELYRPIGYDWLPWWRVSDLAPTQAAYLNPAGEHTLGDDGYWRWTDHSAELEHKCMTLQQFKAEDVGLIVSTHPGHEESWHALWQEHKPSAKLLRVAGNTGETVNPKWTRNLLDSTAFFRGRVESYCAFHQEFPLDVFLDYPLPPQPIVSQYLNFYRNHPMFPFWDTYRPQFPDWEWKMYGHQGDDGFLHPFWKLAHSMIESSFIWHVKREGYGHIIHNAFAAGRPVITKIGGYRGYTAGAMLEDGVTCIDLGAGVAENVAKIRHYAQRPELLKLCANVRERFKRVVDFDAEEQQIRAFLGGLA